MSDILVYIYPFNLTPGDVLVDGPPNQGNAPFPITDSTMLLWVDLQPEMRFTHPTIYVLISAQQTRVVRGGWWPELNGRPILRHESNFPCIPSPFKVPIDTTAPFAHQLAGLIDEKTLQQLAARAEGSRPNGNGLVPDGNGLMPDGNGASPDGNGYLPDRPGVVSHIAGGFAIGQPVNKGDGTLPIRLTRSAPPAFPRVYTVDALEASILLSLPPQLWLKAVGTTRTTGWSHARLASRSISLPADGIWEFDFVAMPTSLIVQPMITPIAATTILATDFSQWRGIRVHAETNSQELLFVDSPLRSIKLGGSAADPYEAREPVHA